LRRDSRETQKRGEETLCAFLEKNDIQYTNTTADQLAAIHNIPKRESFLQALGERTILLGDSDLNVLKGKKAKSQKSKGWRKYVPFIKSDKDKNNEQQQMSLFVVPEKFNRKKPIFITDDNIGQYKFMHCCHPIPGDDILGFIDTKKQIEIHKRSCPVAAKLKTSFGNHILDAKWDMHRKLYFDATIHIEGIDRIGLLNEVTRIISEQMNINMHKVVLSCEEGIFKGTLEVRIHDKDDVKAIIESLKKVDNLQKVTQIM